MPHTPNSAPTHIQQKKSSWHDDLPIHPAAALFPLMSSDELQVLGDDIVENGLKFPIVLWRANPKSPAQLLDGRNRLNAIELATGRPVEIGAPSVMAGTFLATDKVITLDKSVDPYAYVISANIRRRHLSIEDKDRLIVALLKADPTKSNRTVAKLTDTSHPHVAKVQAEETGDVETVTTSIDTRGRKQPSSKARKSKPKSQDGSADNNPKSRDDVGPNSAAEAERLRVRVEELQAEVRLRDIKVTGLESEIEEAKTERKPKLATPKNGKTVYCSFCAKSQHEVRILVAGPGNPPVHICNECIDLRVTIVAERKAAADAPRPRRAPPPTQ